MTSLIPRNAMSSEQPFPAVARSTASSDEIIDLGRLFGLLVDKKWKILFVTFLFALVGFLLVFFAACGQPHILVGGWDSGAAAAASDAKKKKPKTS